MANDEAANLELTLLPASILRSIQATFIGLILLTGSSFFAVARAGTEERDQALRAWVGESLTFFKSPTTNQDALVVHRQPIRAEIRTNDAEIAAQSRTMITNFANAFHLTYAFAPTTSNFMVITADRISDDRGKPDREFLRSLALPESAIDQVVGVATWPRGCGAYDFLRGDARIGASIVAADKRVMADEKTKCIATGILNGFGLRLGKEGYVDSRNDYVQFLLLARAIAFCENKSPSPAKAASVRGAYVDCVFERLKQKMSE